MKVTFVSAADAPLTKAFSKSGDTIESKSYPMVRNVSSVVVDIATTDELFEAIKHFGSEGYALIKGLTNRPLKNESRAGATSAADSTEWLCLDIDFDDGFDSIEDCLGAIHPALPQTAHIVQYSASSGIRRPAKLRSHVFFLLSEAVPARRLVNWLKDRNLKVQEIKNQLQLSASGIALRWPLDPSVAQNDKLIFIAPPTLEGLEDPLKHQRLTLVPGAPVLDAAVVPEHIDHLASSIQGAINELRGVCGKPHKTVNTVSVENLAVATNPDQAEITDEKEERGFVYLNLNGGDSWGYYYPTGNPEILLNFKGEPAVRLKDINPEYYAAIKKKLSLTAPTNTTGPAPASAPAAREDRFAAGFERTGEEPRLLAFRVMDTDTYYNAIHYPMQNYVKVAKCAKTSIENFFEARGQAAPEHIEDWELRYEPGTNSCINYDERWVNEFKASPAMLREPGENTELPPVTGKILRHVCVDEKTLEHFLNWLAFIWQYRSKTGTAWIFHGTEGTGKGLLLNNILRPLFGMQNASLLTQRLLQDRFNVELDKKLVCGIDEVHLNNTKDAQAVMNQLKNIITEPQLLIRDAYSAAVLRESFVNLILLTNSRDPIDLGTDSRRFNVAPGQQTRIAMTDAEKSQLSDETMQFADVLSNWAVDTEQVRVAIESEAKREMAEVASNTVSQFFEALRKGNLDYFADFLDEVPPQHSFAEYPLFAKALRRWAENAGTRYNASRNEVYAVYNYLQKSEMSAARFSRLCAIERLQVTKVRVEGESVRGCYLTFARDAATIDYIMKCTGGISGKVTALTMAKRVGD